ncbi:putative transposase, Ptta/En/Spm, plant [Helianthus annuus]|uniref:Transposase, Ptta/En/Spm, plant n=1 Tax=Helianthus annuus TaxID=4232 RepID=A0A9K3GU80_HELAN|nr:putative transposase, Ptta/En/Spm, plant [Helianthus annuus]
MVQVTGKKSYARVREELKASKGQDPSRLEMFRACFSKDGTTKNLEASNAIVSTNATT